MEKKKPDNVVYSEQKGYNSSLLPYATNVGAPVIKTDDIVAWKTRGIHNVNKEFENKFNELKAEYQKLMEDYKWIGETYHMYLGDDDVSFLSLISPEEWNKEFIASFKLNSDKKWIFIK